MSDASESLANIYMQTFVLADANFEPFELPPDDIVDGDPQTEVVVFHQTEDGAVLAGASRFTEGTYRYRQTADEINYVTRGRMTITSDRDQQKIECVPGSVTRLDKGVTYTKTVLEPYEEVFIMLNPAGAQM